MSGIAVCILSIGAGGLAYLWMKKNKWEKYCQDAAAIFLATAILALVMCVTESGGQGLTEAGSLPRNAAGEGDVSQKVQLTVPEVLDHYDYEVKVGEERLQGEEVNRLFQQAELEAEDRFLNENPSLDEIREAVLLPGTLQDGKVEAKWGFEPEGVISSDGELQPERIEEDGTLVMVSLTMSYYGKKQNVSFGCLVLPKRVSPKDKILTALEQYFREEEAHPRQKEVVLPKKIEGYTLEWSQEPDQSYQILLLLGIVAAMFVCLEQKKKEQKQEQRRREQLEKEYPDMVSKLSLLLGAGMTLSGAWERIALNYQKKRKAGMVSKKAVYEEMLYSYRELQDGIGERQVYEHFGERCGIRQYRKLTALLVQNLRKGSAGLNRLLEQEVSEAFELRKNRAKKEGEQAGTKLLVPMLLMLCIVMVIVLVPAMMSLSIV